MSHSVRRLQREKMNQQDERLEKLSLDARLKQVVNLMDIPQPWVLSIDRTT